MASTFNGSVANLVDPLTTSPLNSPSHAGQHTEINDALQALGVFTSYTPTWTNVTIGNATVDVSFWQANKFVYVRGRVTYGSTTSISGVITMSLPVTARNVSYPVIGQAHFDDAGTAAFYGAVMQASTTTAVFWAFNAAGTYVRETVTSSTVPMTWTTGDILSFVFTYEAA